MLHYFIRHTFRQLNSTELIVQTNITDIAAFDTRFISNSTDYVTRLQTFIAAYLNTVTYEVHTFWTLATRTTLTTTLTAALTTTIIAFTTFTLRAYFFWWQNQRTLNLCFPGQCRCDIFQRDLILFCQLFNQVAEEVHVSTDIAYHLNHTGLELLNALVSYHFTGRQIHTGNLLTGCTLNCSQHTTLTRGYEQNRITNTTSTTRTANAVYVSFCVVRNIVVDYVSDTLNIQASCRNVSRNYDIQFTLFQLINRTLTQCLVHITVQCRCTVTTGFQLLSQLNGRRFGTNENNRRIKIFRFHNTG